MPQPAGFSAIAAFGRTSPDMRKLMDLTHDGPMEWSGIGALALAFGLSSIIGFERELRKKDAGLRTHTLVGVGAALFTLAGRYGFPESTTFDASRIAAQVASGIGFIGAGVIFLRRDVVRGLTTAATIWLVRGRLFWKDWRDQVGDVVARERASKLAREHRQLLCHVISALRTTVRIR